MPSIDSSIDLTAARRASANLFHAGICASVILRSALSAATVIAGQSLETDLAARQDRSAHGGDRGEDHQQDEGRQHYCVRRFRDVSHTFFIVQVFGFKGKSAT